MLGENEDSYVHSYIQTQSTGIACKKLLTLQLLERGEHGGQLTTAEGGNYSNAGLSIIPRGPALRKCDVTLRENQNGRPSERDWLGLKGIKKWWVGGFLSL